MKKHIYYLTVATLLFFLRCSNEPLFTDQGSYPGGVKGVISLKANMPEDDPITRVALAQEDDMAVALTWQEGDELDLVFVQENVKIKKTVTVGDISSDGKKANFDIVIPSEITGVFNLYGVYGGGGLSEDNPTLAVLPQNTSDASLLDLIEAKKDVMLHFASKDLKISTLEASVDFEHLGSLVSIIVKNTSDESLAGLKEVRLTGGDEAANWAYNNGEGGKTFNLETGEFEDVDSGGNYISFNATDMSVADGETLTLWSWSPMAGKTWPELKLEAITPDDNVFSTSVNTKPEAAVAYTAGKVYYYNVEWDGVKLEFKNFKTPSIFVKESGVETNDGSTWAKATTLTKALEIMEEGDEIHIAAGTYIPTNMITGGTEDGDKTFEITKNVTLIGGYPADASEGSVSSKANETILSGDNRLHHVVAVTAPIEEGKKIILKNLHIKHGLTGSAGNILINGVNYPRIYGAGLTIAKARIDVVDCVISDNESINAAGGVYVQYSALAKFINTDIVNNKSTNGGGIMNAATTYLIGCNISDNTSSGAAGGISNSNPYGPADMYIYNSTFAHNSTGKNTWQGGGGIYAQARSYTQIVNSTFAENSVGAGGAIRTHGTEGKEATVDVINSTFYKNKATGNGGAIQILENTIVNIYNSILSGNTGGGGEIYNEGTYITSYAVVGNKLLDKDGAEVADKTFDHTTMISELTADGTCMITGTSPAAYFGMDAILLQTLASEFEPVIDNNIIVNDQLGKSRSGKFVMGAVVPDVIEEPETGVGIKEGSGQVLWAKKLKEDLGVDTLQATGGMAVTKDHVVLNTRGLQSIYLDRMTGEKLGTLNMSSIVVPGGLSNFYNTADDDGNILVCNLAPNDKANDGKFKIWKIKDATSTPELYIEHDEGLALGRKISIKGSIDKDAIITAPIYGPDQQFLRWQVKDGAFVSTTPDKITIDGIEGASWGTHADLVYTDPSDINSDYFVAYYTQPYKLAWVDGTTNSVKGWGPEISSNWVVNAVDYTLFNKKPYVVQATINPFEWGSNDSALLFDASSPESIATSVWELPVGVYGGKESGNGESNGNGTGDVALKVSDDGLKLHLYFMYTNGQVGCVQFEADVE